MAELLIIDTEIPPTACCECGHISDRAGGDGTPEPGDFVLCIRCACLNVFDKDLALRAPVDEEIFQAATDPDVQLVRSIILEANKKIAAVEKAGGEPDGHGR